MNWVEQIRSLKSIHPVNFKQEAHAEAYGYALQLEEPEVNEGNAGIDLKNGDADEAPKAILKSHTVCES